MAGNCYQAAACYLLDASLVGEAGNVVLVHGRPTLQVPPFCEYGHAWVEITIRVVVDGETAAENVVCFDADTGRALPRDLFYSIGRIDPAKCHRYGIADLRRWATETGHWGPWEGPEACGPVGRRKAARKGAGRARRKGR